MFWSLPTSANSKHLVRLQAQPPGRMPQAIVHRLRHVAGEVRTVHRLQGKALESKAGEIFRRRLRLRIDELQFVTGPDTQIGAGLGADAEPVETRRRLDGA